jgi:hypothetical protein
MFQMASSHVYDTVALRDPVDDALLFLERVSPAFLPSFYARSRSIFYISQKKAPVLVLAIMLSHCFTLSRSA